MATVLITVPSVGESISEGIVSRWLKADGSSVQAGEPLLELETDKATNVVPAPGSGVLKIGVAEGETVPIGATVGTIDPAGAPAAGTASGSPGAGETESGATGQTAPDRPNGQRTRPGGPSPAPPDRGGADRPLSPSVRRLVAEQDVDVSR